MRPLQASLPCFYGLVLLVFLAIIQAAVFSSLPPSDLVSLTDDSSTTTTENNYDASPSVTEHAVAKWNPKPPKPKNPSEPAPKGISAPSDAPKILPGGRVIIYTQPEKLDMGPSDETYMYGGYRVSCGRYASGSEDAVKSAATISQRDINAEPGKCVRVGCSGSSAVYYCNQDKSKSKSVSSSSVSFMAQTLSDLCCQPAPGGGESGEIFNDEASYSVVVGYGNCAKGDGDGPYTDKQVSGQPLCRGKPAPRRNAGPGSIRQGFWREDASWAAVVLGLGFLVMLV